MGKNILILNGSPRPGGNTETLAKAFAEGAASAGHSATLLNLRQLDIGYCRGCYACQMGKGDPCIQKDDMKKVYTALESADTLVLATPLYFWTVSAQLKTAMDRMLACYPPKAFDCVLLMAAQGTGDANVEQLTHFYRGILQHLGWKDRGMVLAEGVDSVGDVQNTGYPEEARKLGASL